MKKENTNIIQKRDFISGWVRYYQTNTTLGPTTPNYEFSEQLKESIKPGKMTVDIERELKLYSPKKNPLESVRLPPLAAIGPAVMGRLPDEGYADCTEWLSSPVPGFRTQPKLDPTRTIACSEKNSLIYRQDCGLIPKVKK